MKDQLNQLHQEARLAITEAPDLDALEALRIEYMGKRGKISAILGGMNKLSAEERPVIGALVNQIKNEFEEQLQGRKDVLEEAKLNTQLASEAIDVTMPGVYTAQGSVHPILGTIDRITDIFVGLGYSPATGPEVETEYYNFEALNTPADHPARDMQDTLYLPNGQLLRTQTSSIQIRYMEENEPPFRMICSGRVFRRDAVDASHYPIFHQLEVLAVDEDVTFTDLKGTLTVFLEELLGERSVRFRPSFFPFTEPSMEVDIWWESKSGGRWLEVLGAGMVDPNVFKSVGYDPEKVQGFAAGLGIERLAMLLYGIDDIRLLYNSDQRFLKQF
jgi:phenylalanyl-tRNA synthetase alpha chain